MPVLPIFEDPTIEAMNLALEQEQETEPRSYLGMSSIGDPCERKLWYQWRWFAQVKHDATTLARFADGHYSEDVTASRLKRIPALQLETHNEDGEQFGFIDFEGHFRGHMDGKVLGLLQAPKTWHVWEHKCVNEKKFAKLSKLIFDKGEKNALMFWDEIYYAQAILYMHYSGFDRHYLTCSTAGSRNTISVRTEASKEAAEMLLRKAGEILNAKSEPARISNDPMFYLCGWCAFNSICHGEEKPSQNCRTCRHSEPHKDSNWRCNRWDKDIPSKQDQMNGCDQWANLI